MQSNLDRIKDHVWRVRRQLGEKLRIADNTFHVRGYISNDFCTDTEHEPHLRIALGRALKARSGPFIDVGANLGQTLVKLLSLEPGRVYLGFEPQIAACFFITRFLADNGLSHMKVLPVGLADENRVMTLYGRGESDTMASIAPEENEAAGLDQTLIQVRTGDEALSEAGIVNPAIIKIDVEGAEMAVLRGLAKTVAAARPIVFFEMLPNFTGHERRLLPEDKRRERNIRAEEQFAFFVSNGYEVRQLAPDGEERPIKRFALDDPETFIGSDYVAYPSA